MDDDDAPRQSPPGGQPGDAASRLAGEDLGPCSDDELARRITLLETEIARVARHREAVAAHRRAADALFGPKG